MIKLASKLALLFALTLSVVQAADPTEETKDEIAARIAGDRDVLKALASAKSNLSKPHAVEFHFVATSESSAKALAKEGKSLGYTVSELDAMVDDDGKKYWFFDLVQTIVPSEENVLAHTKQMTELGKKHAVQYDGWGAAVVK
jgi:regulator of ribonuclease activity B